MRCISPTAPVGDTALGLPSLSTRMTARIQDAGTEKRIAASSMNDCHGSALWADPAPAGSAWAGKENETTMDTATIMRKRVCDADLVAGWTGVEAISVKRAIQRR